MWKMKIKLFLTQSWYRANLLDVWKFKWDGMRVRMFDCTGWALPPSNSQRNKIIRLGPELYVFHLKIGSKVFLTLYRPWESNT